jgi:hypothetical protein
MGKVTGIRFPGGSSRRRELRSDNLRAAPQWITPRMVAQVLEVAERGLASREPVAVTPIPTPRVKPTLRIVPQNSPEEHARRSEEREAGPNGPTVPASPPRNHKSMADKATEFEDRQSRPDWTSGRKRAAWARIEANRPLFEIAFDRGLALCDLAHALVMPIPTVLLHTKNAGFHFGKRPPLADPLSASSYSRLPIPRAAARAARRPCQEGTARTGGSTEGRASGRAAPTHLRSREGDGLPIRRSCSFARARGPRRPA